MKNKQKYEIMQKVYGIGTTDTFLDEHCPCCKERITETEHSVQPFIIWSVKLEQYDLIKSGIVKDNFKYTYNETISEEYIYETEDEALAEIKRR